MRISDWSSDVCSSDLAREAVGRLHRPAIIPERRIVAPRRVEMEDDEIADILRQILHRAIIFVALDIGAALVGKQGDQLGDAGLDKVDAGRFERAEERLVGKEWVSTCRSRGYPNH